MPILKIKNDNSETELEEGTEILIAAEDHNLAIPFGCRAGACGTCRVRVLEHPENLSPASEEERFFLENFCKADLNDRLACQLIILGDATIEVVDTGNYNHPEEKKKRSE